MDSEAERFRIKHAGLLARSAQGHAAKGMKIKDQEDIWVSIQHNTFKNWVNVQLRDTPLRVEDLSVDLMDGVALVTLIETLQKRKLKKIKRVTNQHQALENVTTALNAIADDGIKLVNIGNVDIVNGNLKLILGLIWSLIMHYQIGQSKFPPKKLMLAWLKAVLPDCNVTNFTSDWSNGIYLSALLDYCRPGLFRSWKNLNPNNSVDNCKRAMDMAHNEFQIPMVLEPEFLASPYLDDLSGMTYLSYFMKEGGPGFNATLNWVKKQLPEKNIKNFTHNWNDGTNLATLIKKLGGPVRGYKNMSKDPSKWEANLQNSLDAGKKLGVNPVLSPQDLARPDVEHLGPMAYIAYFQWIKPRECAIDNIRVRCDVNNTRVNNPVPFKVDILSKEVSTSEIKVSVRGPTGPVKCDFDLGPRGGKGTFTPKAVGFYEIIVTHEGEPVDGSPFKVRALPDVSKIMFSGIDPCALGSIVEVLINSNGAGGGQIDVTALSPTKRPLHCPVKEDDGVYAATFQPDEAGEWSIGVSYDDEHIQGSPFTCHVYDPNAIKILNLDDGQYANTGKMFTLMVDASKCGWGDAKVDVTLDGRSVPSKTLEVERSFYEVSFNPLETGRYKIYVYFNGHEVKGSPFSLYLGMEKPPDRKSSKKKKKSSKHKDTQDSDKIVKEYSSVIDSPRANTKIDSNSILNKIYDSTQSKYNNSTSRSFDKGYDEVDSSSKKKTYFSSLKSDSSLHHDKNEGLVGKTFSSTLDRPYSTSKHSSNDRLYSSLNRNHESSYSSSFNKERSISPERYSPRRTSFEREQSPLYKSSPTSKKSFDFSPKRTDRLTTYGKSPNSTLNQSDYNSTFESSFNSSANTVINRGTPPKTFRFSSPPPEEYGETHTSSSTIRNYSEKNVISTRSPPLSPLGSARNSPIRTTSVSIDPQSELSAPAQVMRIAQNSAKTNEEYRNYLSESREERSGNYTTNSYRKTERYISSPPLSPHPYGPIASGSSSSSSLRQNTQTIDRRNIPASYNKFEEKSYQTSSSHSLNTYSSKTEEHIVPIKYQSDHFSNYIDAEDTAVRYSSSKVKGTISDDYFQNVQHKFKQKMTQLDPDTLTVNTSNIRLVGIGRTAELYIGSTTRLDEDNIQIIGPGKITVPYAITFSGNENKISFQPHSIGEYLVHISTPLGKVPGSPFRSYVYNSKEIRVGPIPNGVIGKPVEFEIDGANAGSGNLEILVNGGHVTSYVKSLGQQRFMASFVPHSAIEHSVDMKFNGEDVPGSPWNIDIMESSNPRIQVMGEVIRHFPALQLSSFEISAAGVPKEEFQINIVSPTKRPVSYQLVEASPGLYKVSFVTSEVGSYIVEVVVNGQKVQGSPFIAKAYDAGLIRVSDVPNGVVGQPCQFRVDASQAGEGQLEISINDGEVPNHVQVLGGGRCLVSFTPDTAKTHTIDIKFNGETVRGCPFVCKVSDTCRVSVSLRHLELVPVGKPAAFNIAVDGGVSAELTVTVRTQDHTTLPVRVSGSVSQGFKAEFTPVEVGAHTIVVNYNDYTVSGTPFTCKVYDASKVGVSPLPRGAIGKSLQFIVDAFEAGEGNLEISISAADRNIPTQVHPQGSARFAVSFVPLEAIDHTISISFNKEPVPGSPFKAKVLADPHRISVSGHALTATPIGKNTFFTISNVTGSVEDVEISVEAPSGLPIPAQIIDAKDGTFRVEFTPKNAGEHYLNVSYLGESIPGSPFSCKVYDVEAIKVRPADKGMVGKPVTFLVETINAGPGNLEVTVNSGQVPTGAQAQGNHVYAISFTPKEAKPHVVELSFNGESVPMSPFVCSVVDVSRVTVSGPGLEKVPVNESTYMIVDTQASIDQVHTNILSNSRNTVVPELETLPDGKIRISYTPQEVGDHGIEVRVGGVLVPGSPFLVKAYDPTKVKVTDVNSGVVSKPVYFSIDASQAGAGNLEIIVSVNDRNVPNYVQSEGHAKFKVNFKPKEAAVHTLSVKFNGDPVPGSPFKCRVTDSSHVVIGGNGIKMASLDSPAIFTLDPKGTEVGDYSIQVLSPSGAKIPVKLSGELPSKITSEFQPLEVGPHTINILIDGESVSGSPFTCNVYDVTKVKVSGLDTTKVSRPVTFTVDASQAGEGTLELVVSTAKASVRADVAARSRGLYDVTFTPTEPIPHFVNITFNEEEVMGSPFKCEVRELEPKELKNLKRKESQMVVAKGPGLKQVVAGSTAAFMVDTKGLDGELDIRVTGPDGGQVPARLLKIRGGTHRAEYQVNQVGIYNVAVLHKGVPTAGTPYVVEAADPSKVIVQPSSPMFANQEGGLKVDTSKAGRGSLSVAVRAAGSDVKHSIREGGSGQYQILLYPKMPIPHKVEISYNRIPVPGSPFELLVKNPSSGHYITATGVGLYHSKVGKATSFVIETLGRPSKEFDVVVVGPHDWVVPVKCYHQKDGNLLAEFTPHTPGSYQIDVLCSGKNVKGSPFKCTAYDASKIVLDKNKVNIAVGDMCVFNVDKSEAGIADTEALVFGSSEHPLPLLIKSTPEGDIIEWTPEAPGQYKVEVSYGGEEVPGSPIAIDVGESGLASVIGPGLIYGSVGEPASFTIDGRGILGEPTVSVDGPDSVARVNIRQQEEGLYQATYIPNEVGIFDVRIQWNKKDVSGSPFHPKVVDVSKIRLIGGWESLIDDTGKLNMTPREEKKLTFDVSEAGPGKFKADINQDGKILENAIDHTGSRIRLLFMPMSEGPLEMKLWYNDFILPQCPIRGIIPASSSGDHTRVTLKGHGLSSARCGSEAEFTIDGSGAGPGKPDVIMSGTKVDIPVQLSQEGTGIWRAKYTPVVPGVYLLNVMWSDRQVRGCPLKVTIESVADASKVICSGDGLRHGMVGQEIKSFIDTRRAGPGELTARCVGPNKVAVCELYDHRDGTFTLNIRPQESGRHHLSVMYEGEHAPGSPYTLKIAGAPDASKVRVYGPGIEHGVLAAYQSRFICDTRGAGAGQLTVKIKGPKGAFRVEMQRESQKDRTILCKFDPTEPGDYRIEVKWSGENVPGSPFMVMIFDTQDELNRYMSGGYSPNATGGVNEPYGSIGYGYGAVNFGQMSWRGSQAQL